MITYFGTVGNFGKIKDEDLFGRKRRIFEISCECTILLPLSKNSRSSFAVRGTTLKSWINIRLDSYSSHCKVIVGEAYAFMVLHPFPMEKLNISLVLFCMQSIK